MELNEFVSKTLIELINGVKEAQKEAEKYGALVNPNPNKYIQNESKNYYHFQSRNKKL